MVQPWEENIGMGPKSRQRHQIQWSAQIIGIKTLGLRKRMSRSAARMRWPPNPKQSLKYTSTCVKHVSRFSFYQLSYIVFACLKGSKFLPWHGILEGQCHTPQESFVLPQFTAVHSVPSSPLPLDNPHCHQPWASCKSLGTWQEVATLHTLSNSQTKPLQERTLPIHVLSASPHAMRKLPRSWIQSPFQKLIGWTIRIPLVRERPWIKKCLHCTWLQSGWLQYIQNTAIYLWYLKWRSRTYPERSLFDLEVTTSIPREVLLGLFQVTHKQQIL